MKCIVCVLSLLIAAATPTFAQTCAKAAKEVKPVLSDSARLAHSEKLEIAARNYTAEQTADNLIWFARRKGYLGYYKDAIEVLTVGVTKFPKDARMYRHRGHRYITLRCFDDAIVDLDKAAKLIKGRPDEVEPDGLPNPQNIPTSTLQSNIWYHLGLGYYLKGDFKKAIEAYKEGIKVSTNSDMLVATSHWYYIALRRTENFKEAEKVLVAIDGDVEVIENEDYLKLLRLYRGEVRPEMLLEMIDSSDSLGSASLGYGVGNWFLYNRDKIRARQIFRKVVNGNQWASFGFIAAEAELARLEQL